MKFQNKPYLRNQKDYHEREVFIRDQYIGKCHGVNGQRKQIQTHTVGLKETGRVTELTLDLGQLLNSRERVLAAFLGTAVFVD